MDHKIRGFCNLMQELERSTPSGDPDFDDAWRNSIQARFAANATEQRTKNRLLANLTREQQEPDDFTARTGVNHPFFVKNEMYPCASYEPDVARLRASGIPIVLAVGTTTLATNRYYGRPAGILAERLGSRLVTMPGHHNSYFDLPGPWTGALRNMLHDIQRRPRG
jgi:hypothetical protein